eukprot:TRINITY_DN13484_c0_g1_i1.p2 TRINITY_DN13484_c0_g1~~TRINITY_DN13484_c0_g1_i1.p2  ORF type:complete len:249 (+),score=36.98 TRINITY_DN13484_c0_g1_i1:1639-2385(+)
MPHLITNRSRLHNLASRKRGESGLHHFSWESGNAILYLIGGVAFIVGSVFFLPGFDDVFGLYLFVWGSVLYGIVTLHDLFETIGHLSTRKKQEENVIALVFELVASLVYTVGTALFVVGSILFLPRFDAIPAGAWCFIIGSGCFLVGACLNVVQIVEAGTMLALQLLNATAISFVVGSVLFLVASIPYLWKLDGSHIQDTLFKFVAWQFIIGSVFFLAGGVFNFYRAFLVAMQPSKMQQQKTLPILNH